MQKYLPAVGVLLVIALIGYLASFPWVRPSNTQFGNGSLISQRYQGDAGECKVTVDPSAEGQKTYRDTYGRFTLEYPANMAACDYQYSEAGGVYFTDDVSMPGLGGIVVEGTEFASTQAWIDSQPKGSSVKSGITFKQWLNAGPERWAILNRFSAIDMAEDGTEIIGQKLEAVLVAKGLVFTGHFFGTSAGTARNGLDLSGYPEAVKILQSFRLT